MSTPLPYLQGYAPQLLEQVQQLITEQRLGEVLRKRYPERHEIRSNKALYDYVLAHIKEKEHNKAFYKLCTYMEPAYHQLEFDMRLYLTHRDLFGDLY